MNTTAIETLILQNLSIFGWAIFSIISLVIGIGIGYLVFNVGRRQMGKMFTSGGKTYMINKKGKKEELPF